MDKELGRGVDVPHGDARGKVRGAIKVTMSGNHKCLYKNLMAIHLIVVIWTKEVGQPNNTGISRSLLAAKTCDVLCV